jgi:glutaredoxin-like YruB-family protein
MIKIYSTPTCHYCAVAKDYLKDKNIPFEVIDVKEDLKAREHMKQISGQMGVPVIDISGKIMSGWNEEEFNNLLKLLELDKNK